MANTAVTDEGLRRLIQAKRLNRIDLQGTVVSDQGIAQLNALPNLGTLKVSQTNVKNPAIVKLRGIKNCKAWVSSMGDVMDQEGETLEVAKQGILVNCAMSLIPLQEPNKEFKLGLAEPETVEGEECEGITIAHEKMPTITMHFSKKTGLIKKTKYKIKVAEQGFEEVTEEAVYYEYKEFDGFKCPTKVSMYRDGKKFVESHPQKFSYPDKLDENEFKKPE